MLLLCDVKSPYTKRIIIYNIILSKIIQRLLFFFAFFPKIVAPVFRPIPPKEKINFKILSFLRGYVIIDKDTARVLRR